MFLLVFGLIRKLHYLLQLIIDAIPSITHFEIVAISIMAYRNTLAFTLDTIAIARIIKVRINLNNMVIA